MKQSRSKGRSMKSLRTCPRCGEPVTDHAFACTECRMYLRYAPVWKYEVLEISDEADILRFMYSLFGSSAKEILPDVTVVGVRRAFQLLHEQEAQVLIRRFGLDGSPAQSMKQIYQSCEVSYYQVRFTNARASLKLIHPSQRSIWFE